MTAVGSLITAIMLGGFSAIFPWLNPVDWMYRHLFGFPMPDYLYYGFSALGDFTLIYSLFLVLFSPIYCKIGSRFEIPSFDKPSKEDYVFILLAYLVYVYALQVRQLLTVESALVGFLAILLPVMYRLLVYIFDELLSNRVSPCYYNPVLFVISILACIPVTAAYLELMHAVLTYF